MRFLLPFFLFLSTFSLSGYELGIITMFRNETPYLKEWIEYHHLVGVDHFWLYNNSSTDNWKEVLAPYIESGLVEVITWTEYTDPDLLRANYMRNQMATMREGLKLAKGKAKWVAMIDMDEFLLPMKEKTVVECLDKHFSGASGLYVNWRMFGTNHVAVPLGNPLLTKLTACSLPSHPENNVGKSIVRPEQVAIDAVWYPHHFPLIKGAKYLDGGRNELTFDSRNDLKKKDIYYDEFIRINHYNLRDENFYRTRRLALAEKGLLPKSKERLLEHYDSFGKMQDKTILNFLKRYHANAYKKIWKAYE